MSQTCRDEILACARTIGGSTGTFSIQDLIHCMEKRGTRYAESTIRTHITSRMCTNAPDNHAVTYRDLKRIGRGKYRLLPHIK